MSLSSEQEARYVSIIDAILASSDLNTISEKRIRQGLEAEVGHDLSAQKDLIGELINARFDKVFAETAAENQQAIAGSPVFPLADVTEEKPREKKRKIHNVDDDARLAAMLQAEENSRARPTRTRGAAQRRTLKTRKRGTAANSKTTTKVEDDSSADSGPMAKQKRVVNRNGGFHKPWTLSPALSNFLGETTLSRPETVKRLWAYFKEHELQDPKDKRQIRCDDALKAVFKQDRVHMFTMNKILSHHLFAPDE